MRNVMDMARDRKPVNLSLDPEQVAALKEWCKSQEFPVPLARAVDVAIKEFLERRADD